jgi:nicotinamidase-related amidase
MLSRGTFLVAAVAVAAVAVAVGSAAAEERSKMLDLRPRSRLADGEKFRIREVRQSWAPAETAVIVIDMWDKHWCQGATARVEEMARAADRFVRAMRTRGALIVHAPSGCMDAYKDHPARKRAQAAPAVASLPAEIGKWCYKIPAEEGGKYPLDQSDGGCDDMPVCRTFNAWSRQVAAIGIEDGDANSDSGAEVWNLLEQRGIKNVAILGVHLNMCVLGRPFGLRNLARYGRNVVLVRDLTDTMYNSRAWPHVNHFAGTALMVEHVEKWVCPTISSNQVLGGKPFVFRR